MSLGRPEQPSELTFGPVDLVLLMNTQNVRSSQGSRSITTRQHLLHPETLCYVGKTKGRRTVIRNCEGDQDWPSDHGGQAFMQGQRNINTIRSPLGTWVAVFQGKQEKPHFIDKETEAVR